MKFNLPACDPVLLQFNLWVPRITFNNVHITFEWLPRWNICIAEMTTTTADDGRTDAQYKIGAMGFIQVALDLHLDGLCTRNNCLFFVAVVVIKCENN